MGHDLHAVLTVLTVRRSEGKQQRHQALVCPFLAVIKVCCHSNVLRILFLWCKVGAIVHSAEPGSKRLLWAHVLCCTASRLSAHVQDYNQMLRILAKVKGKEAGRARQEPPSELKLVTSSLLGNLCRA